MHGGCGSHLSPIFDFWDFLLGLPAIATSDRDGVFPYYAIMYYGAVGEATFGAVLIIMTLVHVFAAR